MLRHLIHLLALLGLAGASGWAQTQAGETSQTPAESRPFLTRINGLFSGDLPQLDPPGAIKLIFHPHFGDVVRRDYMRVDTGLRWALNDNFELSAEAAVFFTHGFGESAGYGVGNLQFGSKYVFERWPYAGYETSLGLNATMPLRHAPVDMTDGHNHFTPTVVVQHLWTRFPHLTTFAGMGIDVVSDSSAQGIFSRNEPHDDSVSITAGGVYDLGQLKWTLAGTYATTALITKHADHFFYLQPGLLWYVPKKFTLHSKTQWILGLSISASRGPDGTDISFGSRVRAEITFRQVMDNLRWRKPAPDSL